MGQHMSLVDHAWLRMDSAVNLMVVNSVVWTDEPVDTEALRAVIQERMVDEFPRFRQFPQAAHLPFGRGHWEDDPNFDLDRHLLTVDLEAPGDETALQRYVGAQMSVPLPLGRPLWQIHRVSGYNGGSALLFRVHHAVADGMALARVLISLTDDRPDVGFAHPSRGGRSAGLRGIVGGLVHEGVETLMHPTRVVGMGTTAVKDAARLAYLADLPVKDDTSLLNQPLGVPKLATWSRPLSLAVVKEIGRASGCTVNDVLVAALGGGFRSYLLARGEEPKDVRVMIPVDLRPPDQPLPRNLGNAFGLFMATVPAGTADPGERLSLVHRQMQEIKNSPEAVVTISVLAGMGAAPGPLEDFTLAFFASKTSGVVTNVPGPQQPVYIAGAEVKGVIGWVPRAGDIGFGVAIFSYAGTVTVGVAVDARIIPNPADLVAAFEAELEVMAGQPV
jgi:diacylglycerol O-acyltransferase / wax synthase